MTMEVEDGQERCLQGRASSTVPAGLASRLNMPESREEGRMASRSSAFDRLPATVIERILYAVDADSFASLTVLNRNWRRVSESPLLYGYHLSRCSSCAFDADMATAETSAAEKLSQLKKRLLSMTKRKAFEAFLRPRQTLVKLISTSMSSSTAFPQGEAFRFFFSAHGRMLLCLSSSRIIVLDVASDPVLVKHELKTLRRPLGAAVLDDGSMVAVVSSKHQINIYKLLDESAEHIQAIAPNDVPRGLALSPSGRMLAVAYEDHIEIHTLTDSSSPSEQRAVRCAGIDSLSFSSDGFALLGTSTDSANRNTAVFEVPFHAASGMESSLQDAQVQMWTTQILFPNLVSGFSHACLVPAPVGGDDSWVLGYDSDIAAFKAANINKNSEKGSVTYATPLSPDKQTEALPTTLPSLSSNGELLVVGFEGCGLWLYGVPDNFNSAASSNMTLETWQEAASCSATDNQGQPGTSTAYDEPDNATRLKQVLAEPATILRGRQITSMAGISAAQWVQENCQPSGLKSVYQRLVVVAPGGVNPPSFGEEDLPIDGGRVLLLDFQRSSRGGQALETVIEVGDAEPKILSEHCPSMDTQVEIERRRSRMNRDGQQHAPEPFGLRPRLGPPPSSRESYPSASAELRKHVLVNRRNSSFHLRSSDSLSITDSWQLPDSPYDNAQPRSQDTLHRAATAAAATRGRYNLRYRTSAQFEGQLLNESDVDNWIPPPPPYCQEPDRPLPEELRRSLLPGVQLPALTVADAPRQMQRPSTTLIRNMTQSAVGQSQAALRRINTITGPGFSFRSRGSSRIWNAFGGAGAGDDAGIPAEQRLDLNQRASNYDIQVQFDEPADLTHPLSQQMSPTFTSLGDYLRPVSPTGVSNNNNNNNNNNNTSNRSFNAVPRERFATQSAIEEHNEGSLSGQALEPSPQWLWRSYHTHSVSSPNLQMQTVGLNAQSQAPVGLAPPSQTGGYQLDETLPGAALPRSLRVSTDPTSTELPPSAWSEDWRRRIEEWNEQTIHEQSRRGRAKCVVM